jgi:Holliday junction resolvasome RuvABC endonuclease subunit
MNDPELTRLAMGIDFSTLALHVAYGPGPLPYRLRFDLSHLDPEERMTEAAELLDKALAQMEEHWPNLNLSIMVIEKPFFGVNKGTTIILTQVQAACIVTCQLRKWYTVQEDPSKIRKKVLGVGTAPGKGEIKRVAQAWVKNHHHLDEELDPDTSDSVVIWHYAKWLVENAKSG